MKWLKNLLKKPEIKTKQTKKLKFDKIEHFLTEETKEKKIDLNLKVKEFREVFIHYLEKLNNNYKELENSKFDPVILEDKRDISNIVETSRRNYCYNSEKLFVVSLESLKKEDSPRRIKSIVSEVFNKLNKFPRDVQILLNPFQKQMKKISSDLKKLKNKLDEYDSFLNKEYSLIQKEKKVNELVKKIKESRADKKQKEIKKEEIEKEVKRLKKKIKANNSRILEIQNSDEAKEITKLEKQQILFEKQIGDIISDTIYSVNSVSRQIREYLYISDKKEKLKIKNFLENPESLLRGDQEFFEKIIRAVKKNLKDIESDERKRKKFLEIEKNVVDSLNKNMIEHKKISEKSDENIRKIKKLKQEINTEKEEQEIAKLNEQIQQLEKDKKELESKEINEKELLENLEAVLSDIFDKEIKIS